MRLFETLANRRVNELIFFTDHISKTNTFFYATEFFQVCTINSLALKRASIIDNSSRLWPYAAKCVLRRTISQCQLASVLTTRSYHEKGCKKR